MNRLALVLALGIGSACTSFAGTRILRFVDQPLTTLGTAQDAAVVIARIPVITNAVPEAIISHIGSANRLLQDPSAQVEDSNLLSLLRVRLSAEFVSGRHYRISLEARPHLKSPIGVRQLGTSPSRNRLPETSSR